MLACFRLLHVEPSPDGIIHLFSPWLVHICWIRRRRWYHLASIDMVGPSSDNIKNVPGRGVLLEYTLVYKIDCELSFMSIGRKKSFIPFLLIRFKGVITII